VPRHIPNYNGMEVDGGVSGTRERLQQTYDIFEGI
jgi:hypothetical protein